MTVPQNLGRMERVDLRSVWLSEAGDFTPWLAGEENLSLLGDAIGLDLELESQEQAVGPFRADIVARDTASDSLVLIENQIARTDHTHLGQLMTYAAGLGAVTIVWIAERFTDEHRAALDWLNEITAQRINFFGLEIELWRIGSSAVAPKFNVVSNPNEWIKSKVVASAETGRGLSETRQLQIEYWTALREMMLERRSFVKPRKPTPRHWLSFALGRSGAHMDAFANTRDKRIGVVLILNGPDAKADYRALEAQRAEIEREIGSPLEWQERSDRVASHIKLRRRDTDPREIEQWPEQHEWLIKNMEAFHRTFSPRVRDLDTVKPDEEQP